MKTTQSCFIKFLSYTKENSNSIVIIMLQTTFEVGNLLFDPHITYYHLNIIDDARPSTPFESITIPLSKNTQDTFLNLVH